AGAPGPPRPPPPGAERPRPGCGDPAPRSSGSRPRSPRRRGTCRLGPSSAPERGSAGARPVTGRPGSPPGSSLAGQAETRPGVLAPPGPDSGLDGDVEVTDPLPVPGDVLQPPRCRREGRPDVDVDGPGPRGVPLPGVDLARDVDVQGHDGHPKARGEVEGAPVEGPDRPGGDALALR